MPADEEPKVATVRVQTDRGRRFSKLPYASTNWIRFKGSPCRCAPMASQSPAGTPLVLWSAAYSDSAGKLIRTSPHVNSSPIHKPGSVHRRQLGDEVTGKPRIGAANPHRNPACQFIRAVVAVMSAIPAAIGEGEV
jgi:hypothetical protein